jgi:hypothetical protein
MRVDIDAGSDVGLDQPRVVELVVGEMAIAAPPGVQVGKMDVHGRVHSEIGKPLVADVLEHAVGFPRFLAAHAGEEFQVIAEETVGGFGAEWFLREAGAVGWSDAADGTFQVHGVVEVD